MKLKIQKFTFNPFQENTYIIYAENGNAVIIDPGCYERHEEETLKSFIDANNLTVQGLLNTHAHIDHVLGNQFVSSTYNVELWMHEADLVTLNSVPNYSHVYGFNSYKESPQPTRLLKHGESLDLGGIQFDVFFTPGHAPGHVVFYNQENQFVINGDVLFAGSYGRYDLPGASFEALKKSIKEVLFSLPDETIVYCGHGPETTIGTEKKSNPILMY